MIDLPPAGTPLRHWYDAACDWLTHVDRDPEVLAEAAFRAEARVGAESPSLDAIDGLDPAQAPVEQLDALVLATLDELGLPGPDALPLGHSITPSGHVRARTAISRLRLAVDEPAELLIWVDDACVTDAGSGQGRLPVELLGDDDSLVATEHARRVWVGICDCGCPGCDDMAVVVVREGDRVHWEWREHVPMEHGVTFDAAQYDAEVAQATAAVRAWTGRPPRGRQVSSGDT